MNLITLDVNNNARVLEPENCYDLRSDPVLRQHGVELIVSFLYGFLPELIRDGRHAVRRLPKAGKLLVGYWSLSQSATFACFKVLYGAEEGRVKQEARKM